MPPASTPNPENPLRAVTPWIVTLPAVSKMSNTRSIRPASMIVDVAPAPLMVTGRVISRSPVAARSSPAPATVSVYVPAGSVMISAAVVALAALMASRSVQPPAVVAHTPSVPSAVVLTTNVAASSDDVPMIGQIIARIARARPRFFERGMRSAPIRFASIVKKKKDTCEVVSDRPHHPSTPSSRGIQRAIRRRPAHLSVVAGKGRSSGALTPEAVRSRS
jgi:hypothetical protein